MTARSHTAEHVYVEQHFPGNILPDKTNNKRCDTRAQLHQKLSEEDHSITIVDSTIHRQVIQVQWPEYWVSSPPCHAP